MISLGSHTKWHMHDNAISINNITFYIKPHFHLSLQIFHEIASPLLSFPIEMTLDYNSAPVREPTVFFFLNLQIL